MTTNIKQPLLTITQDELSTRVGALAQSSVPFVCLNMLGMKKEEIKYVDKKTGQQAVFFYFAHKATTMGEEPDLAIVRDSVARGEDGASATRPSYKGKQVLIILRGMTKDNKTGIITYETNEIHVIEE